MTNIFNKKLSFVIATFALIIIANWFLAMVESAQAITIPPCSSRSQVITSSVKSVSPFEVEPDQVVTYTIQITTSADKFVDVRLTDTLPIQLQFGNFITPPQPVPSINGQVITWHGAVMANQPSLIIYTATLTKTENVTIGQVIPNTVILNKDGELITESTTITVKKMPHLSITKEVSYANQLAHSGDVVTYTIVVSNNGGADANNVFITDNLPDYVIGQNGPSLQETVYITANKSVTFTLVATIAETIPDNGITITNKVNYFYSSDTIQKGQASASFKASKLSMPTPTTTTTATPTITTTATPTITTTATPTITTTATPTITTTTATPTITTTATPTITTTATPTITTTATPTITTTATPNSATIYLPVIIKSIPLPTPTATETETPTLTPSPSPTLISTPTLPQFKNPNFDLGRNEDWHEFSSNNLPLITNQLPQGIYPHSTPYAVWLGGRGNEQATMSQTIQIPTGFSQTGTKLCLSYYYWINSEETNCNNDKGYAKINGETIYTHKMCNVSDGWKQTGQLDVTKYEGLTVAFSIEADFNKSLTTNFYLDDVSFDYCK